MTSLRGILGDNGDGSVIVDLDDEDHDKTCKALYTMAGHDVEIRPVLKQPQEEPELGAKVRGVVVVHSPHVDKENPGFIGCVVDTADWIPSGTNTGCDVEIHPVRKWSSEVPESGPIYVSSGGVVLRYAWAPIERCWVEPGSGEPRGRDDISRLVGRGAQVMPADVYPAVHPETASRREEGDR